MNDLTTLQQNAAAILSADAYFTDFSNPETPQPIVEVLTQKLGDLENKIKQAISSMGLSVVLISPLGKLPEPLVGDLTLDVPLVAQVTEDPTLNQTGKPALDVVVEIMCLLHGAPTGIGNPRVNEFRLTERPFTLVDESPTYHVNFTAPLHLTPRRASASPIAPP